MGEPMQDNVLGPHADVTDAGDVTQCTIRLRDAFVNYAFSDQLKGALRDVCSDRLAHGTRRFVVDLTAVNVMDSCGLSVLIGMRKVISGDGGRLVLIAISPILLRLFSITRLDGVFEIVSDAAAAEAALAKDPVAPAVSA
jgi:anti-sigma B factor antagonist